MGLLLSVIFNSGRDRLLLTPAYLLIWGARKPDRTLFAKKYSEIELTIDRRRRNLFVLPQALFCSSAMLPLVRERCASNWSTEPIEVGLK